MVERRTEQEISVKEPHSRRLQAKDRSDPAFLDNRSLIPAETALSSLLDHMHVTRTSYTSVQGKDLPRRFQTKEDEFVGMRSEEHTSELQSLMRISYAVFCLKKKKKKNENRNTIQKQ